MNTYMHNYKLTNTHTYLHTSARSVPEQQQGVRMFAFIAQELCMTQILTASIKTFAPDDEACILP